jgi:hypothetical protein
MKNHDWLNKAGGPATRDAGDKEVRKWRAEAFERVAADPGKQWCEDGCGAVVPWENVSAQNKTSYLSLHAATYDVSYERFAEAVKDALGGRELAADEQRSLRGQFEAARKLLAPIEPELAAELDKNHGREM